MKTTHGFLAGGLLALSLYAGPARAGSEMTTHYEFGVNEGGAASITVPVRVPPGIAGMEPQLTLAYASNAGNGILGRGWALTGLSVISRCSKSELHDGERGSVTFGRGDRYCLDGQRLLLVSGPSNDDSYAAAGSEFRTERESFSRIRPTGNAYPVGFNTPTSWLVETKSGLRMYYGLDANSRVRTNLAGTPANAQTIIRWNLQRIEDRAGNSIEYYYCSGLINADGTQCIDTQQSDSWTGSSLLHYIRYTNRSGEPGRLGVVLSYQQRSDWLMTYRAGSKSIQSQRLSAITSYVNFSGPDTASRGQPVRRYEFQYEALEDPSNPRGIRATSASRMVEIQESGRNGEKLPPLRFSYAPDLLWGRGAAYVTNQGGVIQPPVDIDECRMSNPPRGLQLICP